MADCAHAYTTSVSMHRPPPGDVIYHCDLVQRFHLHLCELFFCHCCCLFSLFLKNKSTNKFFSFLLNSNTLLFGLVVHFFYSPKQMMNEHDFNMQMQLNSSVNLGFLCVCLCESFLFFAHLMEQKQTEKQFNSAVLFFAIRSLIFLLQSVC